MGYEFMVDDRSNGLYFDDFDGGFEEFSILTGVDAFQTSGC